jgi:hypothetical protein
MISITITVVVTYIRPQWTYHVIKNVVSDYCSLFFVRYWLVVAGKKPLFISFLVAPVVGVFGVWLLYITLDVTRYSIMTRSFEWVYPLQGTYQYLTWFQNRNSSNYFLTVSALVVHLWLPLFALGVIFARGINALRFATTWVQWALKNGSKRPFQAIGILAAAIVFVATVGLHLR